ncbi:MAG: hypothetical protein ACOYM3_01060 [Terrimicrobiaceae bacterium]
MNNDHNLTIKQVEMMVLNKIVRVCVTDAYEGIVTMVARHYDPATGGFALVVKTTDGRDCIAFWREIEISDTGRLL